MQMRSGQLKARILPRSQFETLDYSRMYELMEKYYDNVTFEVFLSDLYKKSAVILLHDTGSGELMGFSTLLNVDVRKSGLRYRGAFSGDTIIEKSYWGQRALQKAFTKYIVLQKLKNPFVPFYWFLISKGYKTYLLMANNFFTHFPRYESATPQKVQAILQDFYGEHFKGFYAPETGLIQFPDSSCHLRDGVAEITDELISSNPKVAYFQQVNPNWRNGTELACAAELTYFNPIWYLAKVALRQVRLQQRRIVALLPATKKVSR